LESLLNFIGLEEWDSRD